MFLTVAWATMSNLATMVMVDASIAIGVYWRLEFVAIIMVIVTAMSAAAVSVRGGELRSAQTKHDCERKNCNRFYDVHDLLLPKISKLSG